MKQTILFCGIWLLCLTGFAQSVRLSDETIQLPAEQIGQSLYQVAPETDAMSLWALPSVGSTSGNTRAPGNTFRYQRTEYLITPAEMAASGFPVGAEVNSIGFLISTAGVGTQSGNFKVYLRNTTDVTYTLGTDWTTTGFTLVSDIANWTVPIALGSYEVPFSGGSTFTYTGGGVYVAWEFSNPAGALGTTALVAYCNTNLANGLMGQRSSTAMPTTLAASAFRPATLFGNTFYTDIAAVTNIYTYERIPVPFATPVPIDVRVANVSASPASFNVILTVKDATNTNTLYTVTQPVSNLAANTASILNFNNWNPTNAQDVNIWVTTSAIAGENFTANNTLTIPASVNTNLFSYNFNTTGPGGFGFTYPGTGIFAAKFTMNGQGIVTGANLSVGNSATNTGNSIYAVVLNSTGTQVAQSAAYTIQASDIGANINFTFSTPPVFTDEVFYVGLAQTAGTAQYYPMGTFPETPQRDLTWYTADYGGGNLALLPSTFNLKYGIEAQVAPNFTLPIVTTTSATLVTASSATINGTVNASGNNCSVSFEYGLTTAYGTTIAATPATVTGSSSTPVSAGISGLAYSTTYNYRVVATIGLFKFYGNNMTFTTSAAPPTVVTLSATGVGSNDATLRGTVNANNQSSTVSFQYGLTTAYGSTIAATPSPVTGTTVTNVSAAVSGLIINQTYHYRVVATSSAGTSYGSDVIFITGCSLPEPPGAISGPASLCAGTNGVNFSVAPIQYADSYEWTVPAGATIVSGATTNSIIVNFGATAVSGDVTVKGISSCGDGPVGTTAVTVNPLPVPTLVSGPTGVCVGVTGVHYITQSGMTGYTWTISSGGVITAGAGTNNITVSWNTVGAQTLSLTYTSAAGCAAASPATFPINVVAQPVPVITGPASACQGVTTNVYSTQSGMSNYTWTVSAGGAITAGAGTNAITVTWSTLGAKTVTVNYTNPEGCSATSPTVYNVIVNPVPAPTLTGATQLCAGTNNVVYTTEAGFSNYQWSISYGGIITAGQTSNQITVNWFGSGTKQVFVNYSNSFGCSALNYTALTVNVLPAPVPTLEGPASVCQGATGQVYTTQPGGSNYVWAVSSGGVITGGQGTPSVTVSWTGIGSQTISVNFTNESGCPAITPTVLNVSVNPYPSAAGAIAGNASVCAGATNVPYVVPPINNAVTYEWTLPAGATIVNGAGTRSIKVNFASNAVSGIIKVAGANDCGLGASSPAYNVVVNPIPPTPVITQHIDTLISNAANGNQWYKDGQVIPGATSQKYVVTENGTYKVIVTLNDCSSPSSNEITILNVELNKQSGAKLEIFPNPSNGRFEVRAYSPLKSECSLEVYNSIGAVIISQNIVVNGSFSIPVDLADEPSGTYMVILRGNDFNVSRKIIINH